MEKEKIVFFDGVCNLCIGSVQFLLRFNRSKSLTFASLQSEYFQRKFPNFSGEFNSILYYKDGVLKANSTAVLEICRELVFPFSMGSGFLILPVSFRDFFYRWIATHRYSIFGKREVCYLPTEELTSRFLN